MNLKKVVAALSAVTMLGSLAAAVPASAATKTVDVLNPTASTAWFMQENDSGNGIGYVGDTMFSGTGTSNKLTGTTLKFEHTDGTIGSPVQIRTNDSIKFEAGATYTVSVDFSYDITSYNTAGNYAVMYVRLPNPSGSGYTDMNMVYSGNTKYKDSGTKTYTFTMNADQSFQPQFYFRHAFGECTYSNIKITKTVTATPATVEISNTYDNKILHNNDSFDMSAIVKDAEGDVLDNADVTWSVQKTTSGPNTELQDANTNGYSIKDGRFTLTNTGRDTPGNDKYLYIKATSGEAVSETLKVKVDRLKSVTYVIKEDAESGATDEDTKNVTCSATVNGSAITASTVNNSSAWKYNGYMNATMVLTAPEGYTLTVPATSNCYTSVSGSGTQTVTITRNGTNASDTLAGNDFYVEATLKKVPRTEYYAITGKTDTALTKVVINVNDTAEGYVGDHKAIFDLGSTISAGDVLLALTLTDIPDGVTINSVTLE